MLQVYMHFCLYNISKKMSETENSLLSATDSGLGASGALNISSSRDAILALYSTSFSRSFLHRACYIYSMLHRH